eukprot:FR742918.1.p1 GENE.FR742918.1~~FR742918.1.p1  ORF type:complete len:207 (+),score=8.93 FR742918.1:1-621(+)
MGVEEGTAAPLLGEGTISSHDDALNTTKRRTKTVGRTAVAMAVVTVAFIQVARTHTESTQADLLEAGSLNTTSCDEFDDDTVYNSSSCGIFDETACGLHCFGYCTLICGSACDEESGAICALQAIRNMTSYCNYYGLCNDDASLMSDSRNTWSAVTGPACDDHALCEFCFDDESCYDLYLEGVIASASGTLHLLSKMEGACPKYFC